MFKANDIGKGSYGALKVKQAFEYAYLTLSEAVAPQHAYLIKDNQSILGRIIRITQEVIEYRRWIKELYSAQSAQWRIDAHLAAASAAAASMSQEAAMSPSMSLMHASLLGNNLNVMFSSDARAALNSTPLANTAPLVLSTKGQQVPQAFVQGLPLAPAALTTPASLSSTSAAAAPNGSSNPTSAAAAAAAATAAVTNMFPAAAAAYMMPFMNAAAAAMAAAAAAAANTNQANNNNSNTPVGNASNNSSTSTFPGNVPKTFNNFHQQHQQPFANLTNKQQQMTAATMTPGFNPMLFHQLSNPAQFFQQQQQQLQQQQQQNNQTSNNNSTDHNQHVALLQHYQNNSASQNPTSSSKNYSI